MYGMCLVQMKVERFMRNILVLLAVAVCLVACDREKKNSVAISMQPESTTVDELSAAAAQVNAACPVKAGEYNTMDSVSYRDNVWTYYYSVAEDSIVTFQNQVVNQTMEERMKQSTRDKIFSNAAMRTMVEAFVKVKADLVFKFRGDRTGTTIKVVYTNPELRVMMDVMRNQKQ